MNETVNIDIQVQGIDESIKKLEKYISLIKEAKTLADELASVDFEITYSLQQ